MNIIGEDFPDIFPNLIASGKGLAVILEIIVKENDNMVHKEAYVCFHLVSLEVGTYSNFVVR